MLAAQIKALAQSELNGARDAVRSVGAGQAGEEHRELVTREAANDGVTIASTDLRHDNFAKTARNPG